MKKNILNLSVFALIVTATLFTGCKKDEDAEPTATADTTAPTITLTGNSSVTISLQEAYTELGATATDEKDGSITPTVSGTVN